jgi:hypothetical protein
MRPHAQTLSGADARRFIRHPTDIPIHVEADEAASVRRDLANVSQGGLCFHSRAGLPIGAVVRLEIPVDKPPFTAQAIVVWCQGAKGDQQIGVRFLDEQTAFAARMVEQVCHIQEYRRRVLADEGRDLSGEQAATEWIARFAGDFPSC